MSETTFWFSQLFTWDVYLAALALRPSAIVKILTQTGVFMLLGVFGANCSKQTHWNHWSQEFFAKSSSGDQVGRVIMVGVVRTVLNLCFMWPLEFCGKDVQRMVSISFSIQFSFHVFQRQDIKVLEILDGFHWHDECPDIYVISIDEIPMAGSLGESSYRIYVGQVLGQWQQGFWECCILGH